MGVGAVPVRERRGRLFELRPHGPHRRGGLRWRWAIYDREVGPDDEIERPDGGRHAASACLQIRLRANRSNGEIGHDTRAQEIRRRPQGLCAAHREIPGGPRRTRVDLRRGLHGDPEDGDGIASRTGSSRRRWHGDPRREQDAGTRRRWTSRGHGYENPSATVRRHLGRVDDAPRRRSGRDAARRADLAQRDDEFTGSRCRHGSCPAPKSPAGKSIPR